MIKWKSKTLLAKVEATYGEDSGPSAAANAILALNVRLSPMEGEDARRETEKPYFGADPSIPTGLYSTLTFDVELVGSGTAGTAPGWGPLLRMCGVAETIVAATSVEYTPITDEPESGTIHFAIGTTRHVLLGTRGTCMLKVSAQGIPMLSFTMTGLFTVPSTVAAVSPDFSGFQDPEVATNANTPVFTIGGDDFVMRDFELNLGNDVQRRLLVGVEAILIVDKAETVKARVEAVPLGTYDPFTVAKAQTKQAIVLEHGTIAGRKVKVSVPSAQQGRLTGYEPNQDILEWPLDFTPLPTDGDDQWALLLT